MGAWGYRNFENDDAGDWVLEFEAKGIEAVRNALRAVAELSDEDYLEAPESCIALAAAEIVASAKDGDISGLPEEARVAFAKHKDAIDAARDPALAFAVVRRVLTSSELLDLWEEDTGLLDDWKAEVNGLIARLA